MMKVSLKTLDKGREDKSRWLCVIGAGKSQVPFIQAAQRLGINTLVFDRDINAPGAELADRFEAVSTHDVEGIVSICKQAAQSAELVGCITYSAYLQALEAAARVVELLRVPGFSLTALENTTNKSLMKMRLRENQIPTPGHCVVHSKAELKEFLGQGKHEWLILKPALGGTGSAGIALVSAEEQESDYAFTQAQQESTNDKVIVEGYYPGQEYTVDGYVQGGYTTILNIAHKFTLESQYHFAIEGFATGKLDESDSNNEKEILIELVALTRRVIDALEIDDSFFSIDVIVGKYGSMVIDVGLLLDAKIDRILYFANLDIYELYCHLAMGQETDLAGLWGSVEHGYALRFLYTNESGILHPRGKVTDQPSGGINVRALVEWERQAGDIVTPPKSVSDVIGWLMVEADDRSAAWHFASNQPVKDLFTIEEKVK